jgi:hypothetical protein
MSDDQRPDFRTRFKKGQSGNPDGRPKGRKNKSGQIKEVLFKTIRINDGSGVRSVPKIVAAIEVCLNKALKGDLRALEKMLKIAEKLESFQWAPPIEEISCIRRIIVDPKEGTETEI